jgi:hypothetical protein
MTQLSHDSRKSLLMTWHFRPYSALFALRQLFRQFSRPVTLTLKPPASCKVRQQAGDVCIESPSKNPFNRRRSAQRFVRSDFRQAVEWSRYPHQI